MIKWEPLQPGVHVSKASDPQMKGLIEAHGREETKIYRNNIYTVTRRERPIFDKDGLEVGTMIQLSIHDHARSTRRDWRHFQKIKNELLGPEEEAIELYPAESRLVDLSNEYSLWSIKGWKWPIGYAERWVSEGGYEIGGRQRKWDPDDRPADLRDITKEDIEKYLSGKE